MGYESGLDDSKISHPKWGCNTIQKERTCVDFWRGPMVFGESCVCTWSSQDRKAAVDHSETYWGSATTWVGNGKDNLSGVWLLPKRAKRCETSWLTALMEGQRGSCYVWAWPPPQGLMGEGMWVLTWALCVSLQEFALENVPKGCLSMEAPQKPLKWTANSEKLGSISNQAGQRCSSLPQGTARDRVLARKTGSPKDLGKGLTREVQLGTRAILPESRAS